MSDATNTTKTTAGSAAKEHAAGRRNAILTAASLEVQCPHCGEPQPNPANGSHLWMPSEITVQRLACVACDKSFRLLPQSRVSVIL